MKKLLFIIENPPYQNFAAQEFLDTIFFAASYGWSVNVYFCGLNSKGYFERPGFDTKKNCLKQLSAFPLFDIESIYVKKNLLDDSQLKSLQPSVELIEIESENQNDFFQQFDYIIKDKI